MTEPEGWMWEAGEGKGNSAVHVNELTGEWHRCACYQGRFHSRGAAVTLPVVLAVLRKAGHL